MSLSAVLKPRMSEKAFSKAENSNVYVFEVPMSLNKDGISQAIAKQFDVTVLSVNVVVAKGKSVQSYRKRSRAITAKRRDFKKAYVTLKKGDSIAIFNTDSKPATAEKSKTKKEAEK